MLDLVLYDYDILSFNKKIWKLILHFTRFIIQNWYLWGKYEEQCANIFHNPYWSAFNVNIIRDEVCTIRNNILFK